MLDLLTGADFNLLYLFWAISLSFYGLSIILCAIVVCRRMVRNRSLKTRNEQKTQYQRFVQEVLDQSGSTRADAVTVDCHIDAKIDILLHLFRTIKGAKFELLQDFISETGLENEIAIETMRGVRGARMKALRTLSYLNSQNTLQVIFKGLSSEDKYVQLTAMRCLVRRQAKFAIPQIIETYVASFPEEHVLLASILSDYGRDISDEMESCVKTSEDPHIQAACLEALAILRTGEVSLNLKKYMQSSSQAVRSAALGLAATVGEKRGSDLLSKGLRDQSVAVQIRAAKLACKVKRPDLVSALYELSKSQNFWVRYWAFRAMWAVGMTGRNFVKSRSETDAMAANVALEMQSGYV